MNKHNKFGRVTELALANENDSVGSPEILQILMLNTGLKLSDLTETREGSKREVRAFFPTRSRAERVKRALDGLSLDNVSVRLKTLYKSQWRDKWKKDFSPFALTPKIDIVPVWRKEEYQPTRRKPIYIDTITAFGTGLHETTRFLSLFIEELSGCFKTFLDIGTGTGILTLVAAKSGAQKIWAVDIDKECIEVTNANLAVNGVVLDHLEAVDIKDLRVKDKFDLVAANLTTLDLIRLRRKIFSFIRPDGFLAVSVISIENSKLLDQAFKKMPLRRLNTKQGKDWVAVLFKKVKKRI